MGAGADAFGLARLELPRDSAWPSTPTASSPRRWPTSGWSAAVTVLALLAAWLVAAARATGCCPRRGPRPEWTAERAALLALALCAVAFGAAVVVDWTWFVPGPAIAALVAAGFVAGRGPARAVRRPSRLPSRPRPARPGAGGSRPARASCVAVGAVRAGRCGSPSGRRARTTRCSELLEAGDLAEAARAGASARARSTPTPPSRCSAPPACSTSRPGPTAAYRVLEQAVLEHPRDPETWLRLAAFELDRLDLPDRARATLEARCAAPTLSSRAASRCVEQRALRRSRTSA